MKEFSKIKEVIIETSQKNGQFLKKHHSYLPKINKTINFRSSQTTEQKPPLNLFTFYKRMEEMKNHYNHQKLESNTNNANLDENTKKINSMVHIFFSLLYLIF